jgi:hypothetical protein
MLLELVGSQMLSKAGLCKKNCFQFYILLTVVVTNISILLHVTECITLEANRSFRMIFELRFSPTR